MIPLVGMQFSNEVNWKLSDFIVAGALLFSTTLACDFTLRKIDKIKHRIAIFATILLGLALIWAELSVGIFGTPFSGN